MYLAKQVLDKGLVDRNGHKVGKVDDLILQLHEDGLPVVCAIRSGQGALARYLGGPIAACSAWLRRKVLGTAEVGAPVDVGWDHVTQIDVVVHLDLDRQGSPLMGTENAIWNRWIRHIPWAER